MLIKRESRKQFVVLAMLGASIFSGCNDIDQVDSLNQPNRPQIKIPTARPGATPIPSQAYSKTVPLEFIKAGDLTDENKSNLVAVSGVGTESTYSVKYTFSTTDAVFFQVLSSSLDLVSCSNVGRTEVRLFKGTKPVDYFSGLKTELDSYSEYTLEFFRNPKCDSIQMAVSLFATLEAARETDISFAKVCKMSNGDKIVMFPSSSLDAYLYGQKGVQFLGTQSYCGEKFDAAKSGCTINANGNFYNFASASCTATRDTQTRSFDLTMEKDLGTLTCKTNDQVSRVEKLSECKNTVQDLNLFN